MKHRKRNGFTLIEVVVAFIVVGLIASLVGGVITNSYALSARLKKYPNAYYTAQGDLEKKLKLLKEKVGDYYRTKDNDAKSEIRDYILSEGAYENMDSGDVEKDGLRAYRNENISIFGRTVETYTLSITSDKNGVTSTLYGGVCDVEVKERPIPAIKADTFFIKIEGDGAEQPKLAKSEKGNVTLKAEASWDPSIYRDYQQAMLYQWYCSTSGYHTVGFDQRVTYGSKYEKAVPSYPDKFRVVGATVTDDEGNQLGSDGKPIGSSGKPVAITGGNTDTLEVSSLMRGRTYLCVVTPLGKTGDMGESVASINMIYVPSLPEIEGEYAGVMDCSLQDVKTETDTVNWSAVDGFGDIKWQAGPKTVTLNVVGDATWDNANTSKMYASSRYVTVDKNRSLTLNVRNRDSYDVFIVAKPEGNGAAANYDFARMGSKDFGFSNSSKISTGNSSNGWKIIHQTVDEKEAGVLTVGTNDKGVRVAEVIVVKEAEGGDVAKVLSYLSSKYSIKIN